MKKILLALVTAVALAACGSDGTPMPIPPAAPWPGQPVVTADWSKPLSAAGTCAGSPFVCVLPAGTEWGLLPADDGSEYRTDGALEVDYSTHGGALLHAAPLLDRTKPLSIEEVVQVDWLDCSTVAYVGPVAYGGGVDDGDPTGRYRALYISCFPGNPRVQLWLYSPTWAGPLPGSPEVATGVPHALRIDWYPGLRVEYYLDGQLIFTETSAFGHDPLDAPHDLYAALWFGSFRGRVTRYAAYSGP